MSAEPYNYSDGVVNAEYSGCEHYKRKCQLLAPCCNTFYSCRFCHDTVKNDNERDPKKRHVLSRKDVQTIRCMRCGNIQPSAQNCTACSVTLGNYFCGICNLFDDTDKGQFHCDGCGICRVGGKENFFHCDSCSACIAMSMRGDHKCTDAILHQNCPICMEYMHTSIKPATFLQCGHPLHKDCLVEFTKAGNFKCPMCSAAIADMSRQWAAMDLELALTPMPGEYATMWVRVLCNDCHKESDTKFHIIALKCRAEGCGSYNTRKLGPAAAAHDSPEEIEAENARVNAILEAELGRGGTDEESDDSEEGDTSEESSSEDNTEHADDDDGDDVADRTPENADTHDRS